ncbi:MAG: DUF5678 domain-containing protein [Candidatus Promineifilaceae bacterium]
MPIVTTVPLKADLLESVQKLADEQGVAVENVLEDMVRQYLHQNRRENIRQENEHFVQMHPELIKRYKGHQVAIHQGKLVDHDRDLDKLVERIKARFGRTPVLITPVTDEPSFLFSVRRPQMIVQ